VTSLAGQLLVSMPQMSDPFFARSVVYLCTQDSNDGAMGLIINRTIVSPSMDELYAQLEIAPAARPSRREPVHFGGPVAPGKGFVLHSADYQEEGTLRIDEAFALTATRDILRARAQGAGPRQSLVAVGYSGWGAGQLESEIEANAWLLVAADTSLVFDVEDGSKWHRALAKLGVRPEMLAADGGRA